MHGSGLTGALLPTPPPENQLRAYADRCDPFPQQKHHDSASRHLKAQGFEVDAWMEVWDYMGGASFRAFVASNGEEKSLFVFFNLEGVMGRDLKKA